METLLDQILARGQDANVGLDATQNDSVDGFGLDQCLHLLLQIRHHHGELGLADKGGGVQVTPDLIDSGPKALGVLLGDEDGHVQDLGGFDQPLGVADHGGEVKDGGSKLFLDITNKDDGLGRIQLAQVGHDGVEFLIYIAVCSL